MVERQLRRRGITDERVLAAMARVPRELFVPESVRSHAYEDGALPIGHGQTISQPFVVATICSLLGSRRGRARPRRRHRIRLPGRRARRARVGGRDDRASPGPCRDGARGARGGRHCQRRSTDRRRLARQSRACAVRRDRRRCGRSHSSFRALRSTRRRWAHRRPARHAPGTGSRARHAHACRSGRAPVDTVPVRAAPRR